MGRRLLWAARRPQPVRVSGHPRRALVAQPGGQWQGLYAALAKNALVLDPRAQCGLGSAGRDDLETIIDMFFDACLVDWKEEGAKLSRWAEKLNQGSQVRLVGKETDLSFSVQGRRWMPADGKLNMPDGEIATAPVTETIDGQIYFEFPGVLGGRLMHDMRLRWEKGQLVEATASTNQDFLQAILDTDWAPTDRRVCTGDELWSDTLLHGHPDR